MSMILQITKTDGTVHRIEAPNNDVDDFSDLDLSQAWIRDRELENKCFFYTNLTDARFENCDLYWATFYQANLTNAIFVDCILQGAILEGAILKNTTFINCNLGFDNLGGYTDMTGTNLESASFINCETNGLKTDETR